MPPGSVARISGVTVDITDRKEAEERQALLAREVDHRAKNALALVQSIVRLTRANSDRGLYRGGGRPDQGAVARAHDPVAVALAGRRHARPGRRGARALSHRRPSRIVTAGPNVSLQPAAAQTLALALHELVTNAAKYGALSSAAGQVHLNWELNPGTLVLRWTETGGPLPRRRRRRASARGSSRPASKDSSAASAEFDWRPEGCNAFSAFRATR